MKLEFTENNYEKIVQVLKVATQAKHASSCNSLNQKPCDCQLGKANEALRIAQTALADASLVV